MLGANVSACCANNFHPSGSNQQAVIRRSHPAQHGEGFDAPPTIKRSGSEHRRAVTSFLLRRKAWLEVEFSLQERRRGRKVSTVGRLHPLPFWKGFLSPRRGTERVENTIEGRLKKTPHLFSDEEHYLEMEVDFLQPFLDIEARTALANPGKVAMA